MQKSVYNKETIMLLIGIVGVVIIVLSYAIATFRTDSNTGGYAGLDNYQIAGSQAISSLGFSEVTFVSMNENLVRDFMLLEPSCEKERTIENLNKDENNFKFVTRICSRKYDVELTDNWDTYSYKISRKKTELATFDSSKIEYVSKHPLNLATKLPYTSKLDDGISYTVQYKNGNYEILVNHCSNEKLKNRVREAVKDWLFRRGYNYEDFDFRMPEMCDGGAL